VIHSRIYNYGKAGTHCANMTVLLLVLLWLELVLFKKKHDIK